jgi:hypothetical protein
MEVLSVERDTRNYYLTYDKNPKGKGILAIISLGSPQRGDAETTICDIEICKNVKAAKKWYARQMKTKPWQKVSQAIPIQKGLGGITGLRAEGGKLIADTESGTPMIVPITVEQKASKKE